MFVDTTFCIDLIREARRKKPGPAWAKLATLPDERLFMSVFVMCELQAGARRAEQSESELARIEALRDYFDVVYPNDDFAQAYGHVEATLARKGVPIPTMDLLIGVMAKQYEMPLLTADVFHFQSISGLRVESY